MSVALGPDSAEPISAADYVAAIASLVVLVIYFSLEVTLGLPISHSIGMYIVSFMIITIAVPPIAAAIFKSKSTTYQTWVKRGAIDFKTMISMNATIIAGVLIFITVSNLNTNILLAGLFTPQLFRV